VRSAADVARLLVDFRSVGVTIIMRLGTWEESLWSQFQVPTHGLLPDTEGLQVLTKNRKLFTRCLLCLVDVATSMEARTKGRVTRSALSHLIQHATNRSHQLCKLNMMKGVRASVKAMAHKAGFGGTPDLDVPAHPHMGGAYDALVKDIVRLDTYLCSNADEIVAREADTTPTTYKILSRVPL
jgi:hypothetical protein